VRTVEPDNTTDFTRFVEAAQRTKPDMIFFGGEYHVAATLRAQATAAGVSVPLVGGDGIKDPTFIEDAGSSSKGTLASTVGVQAGRLASAKPFLRAYAKAAFAEPPTDFGPYAYDAANVLIHALATVLEGRTTIPEGARAKVVAAVQGTRTDGVTGRIAFDRFGDTTHRVFTLYRVQKARGHLDWVPINP
jgi:branched-chain amino acid transport system substrate-binding protein